MPVFLAKRVVPDLGCVEAGRAEQGEGFHVRGVDREIPDFVADGAVAPAGFPGGGVGGEVDGVFDGFAVAGAGVG